MPKTITQKVLFKNTAAEALYNLYMDAKLHALVTGAPAKISKKAGTAFSAHGSYISGKTLHLVKNELIVQTWRGEDWNKKDADSIFMISLERKGKDTMLHAVHANVPDKEAAGIDQGWHDYYWKPWKQQLAGKKITRPEM